MGEDGAVQQDEGVERTARGIERSNTTHGATRWAEGVQRWRKAVMAGTTYPSQEVVWQAPLYRTAKHAETEGATVAFGR